MVHIVLGWGEWMDESAHAVVWVYLGQMAQLLSWPTTS
jgi:hypothetical protein